MLTFILMKSDLAVNLKRIREERGMSVIELARRIGVSRQQIYQVEWGESGLSLNSLLSAARALDCELIELCERKARKRR